MMSALGFLAGVAAGRLIELGEVDDKLAGHNARLLAHAQRVSQESLRLMAAATHGAALCSESDVATLRVLLFNSTFLRDIGRLRDGKLVCSAAWGALPDGHALPAPAFTLRNGVRLWVGAANVIDRRISGDMAANGDVVVFTAPGAFDGFPEPGSGIDAKIVTRDGAHVYRRFGQTYDLELPVRGGPPGKGSWSERRAWACAPEAESDLCVVSRTRSDAWFRLPAMVLSLVGALALAFLAGLFVIWRLHARSPKTELRKAILGGEIRVHYQPLRQLATRRLAGFEALARWRARNGREVSPAIFVPLAEAMGLGRELSRQVTAQALRDLHGRLREDPALYVSINVSAADLKDADYRSFLRDAVREQGLAPSSVALEITEGTPLSDGHVLAMVKALRAAGFKVFIDDFGTGHSNLNYLAEMQADAIKLDRRFTRAIGTDKASALIIDHVIDISRELRISLIIEGIETEEQARYLLARTPAAIGQGWLLGRPAPASDIALD